MSTFIFLKMMKCQYCSNIFTKQYLKLHMQFEHHTHLSCVKYSCRFKSCDRSYSDYKTLNKHQRRCKHFKAAVLEPEVSQTSIIDMRKQATNIFNNIEIDSEIFKKPDLKETRLKIRHIPNNEIESNNDIVFKTSDTESGMIFVRNDLRTIALQMISSLHSDATLSRIQIDRITRIFHLFLNTSYVNDLKKYISFMESPNSNHIVEKFEILQNVFSNLESEYKRNKLLTNEGYYIEPTRIFFGTMEVKNENALKTVNVYGQLISLKQVLKAFFEISNVFEKTCKYITTLNENDTDEICNIIQTNFWKSKILDNESITFPLFLYEDAFETTNPLGSHAGMYKLNGIYLEKFRVSLEILQ